MKKPKITITVLKEDSGYSAYTNAEDNFISTQAEGLEELKSTILEAVNLTFEEKDFVYTLEELSFTYDLASFFDFYKVINASALSKRLNMPQSLLAQYITGVKKPSPKQTQRILQGVQKVGQELSGLTIL